MYNDILSAKDFSCVGVVTSSCNNEKLCIGISDAFTFDLEGLLCYDFLSEILIKWREINENLAEQNRLRIAKNKGDISEEEEYEADMQILRDAEQALSPYRDLIYGSEYLGCKGKKHRHIGIKLLWVYYAYSHYVKINPFDDTPNGLTHKASEYSMPATIGELNTMSINYRNKAVSTYQNIKEYLCLNKDKFPKFDACDCHLSCGCTGSCGCGGTKKIGGFKYKSISKNARF